MLQLLMLAAYGLDGFAYAAEGLAGNAAGAGDLQKFHQAVAACWRWSLVTALTISLCFALLAPLLYPLFTIHIEVLQILNKYHFWLVLMPLSAVLSYLLDGVFIGAARSRYMMYGMAISVGLVYLPAWWLLRGYGNHGLWAALLFFQ